MAFRDTIFCIDLRETRPEVAEYDRDLLASDLALSGAKSIDELSDEDFRLFRSENAAKEFLNKYFESLAWLESIRTRVQKNGRCLRMRRRYIVQAVMKLKLSTERNYKKAWRPGDRFNLSDQTFLLPVILKNITQLDGASWRYDYDLE